jgi:VWFA-related protein
MKFLQKYHVNTSRLFILLGVGFSFSAANSQTVERTLLFEDSVTVSVSNIAIDSEFSFRGLAANFPYPILTTISLIDNRGNPIVGLADTTKWLGPNDLSQIGLPISSIWQPLLEYHLENPAIPENPDIYAQTPEPLITEVHETTFLPTSTMLVMDISGSMQEEIEEAKAGARLFVDQMRPVDQAGIIQFNDGVKVVQPMTSDTMQLGTVINQTTLGPWTALWDAIMKAVQETKSAPGRRGIIVYTDGLDNRSVSQSQAVIDSARSYNIPIFAIALGDETSEEELANVASNTGGIFFKAATAEQMRTIFVQLSKLIQNFYIMAHSSPDPQFNNTWRVVDISVKAANYGGQGNGQYFVAGPPTPVLADLAIELSSTTDSTLIVEGKEVGAIRPGEQYQHRLRLVNMGPGRADTVKLFHFLPDSVQLIDSSQPPQHTGDFLVWDFIDFAVGDTQNIIMNVKFSGNPPPDLLELSSLAHVVATNDTLQENNVATDTLLVLFAKPRVESNYDLAIVQTVVTDTTSVVVGDTVQAVRRGGVYNYELKVENFGPGTAREFTIFDAVPDSVTALDFNIEPDFHTGKTYFWRVDSLETSDSIIVTFNARVSDSLEYFPFELLNTAEVIAEKDTNSTNDSTSTTVYAIRRPGDEQIFVADVSVTQSAFTDSASAADGDTLRFARIGETYSYAITLENHGPFTAQNVALTDLLPSLVLATEFQTAPDVSTEDSLQWYIRSMLPRARLTLRFNARVADDPPVGKNLLINQVTVRTTNENPADLANNTAVDTVINLARPQQNLLPLIEARPAIVDIGDTVSVRVQTQVAIQSWDLWVYFTDNRIDSSYADTFIAMNLLEEGQWLNVTPEFTNVRLFTQAEREQMIFELRTLDIFGSVRTARAIVTVQSSNNLVLDRNVFAASRESDLEIKFKLNSNRVARLDVFDVAGSHVAMLTESPYNAGWNNHLWNGLTENGQKVGSGLYVITLRSGNFQAMKKVMVVR